MSAPTAGPVHAYSKFQEEARRFFEAQLEDLGLGHAQIEEQSITDLEDSLVHVDDALRSPDSFGVLRLRLSVNIPFIARSDTGSDIEVGIVPLLLARKKAIISRLRTLRTQRAIKTLDELIESVTDHGLREQLRMELDAARHAGAAKSGVALRRGHGFIAMAMDPQDLQLEDVLDAIKDGAQHSGVKAERIDEAKSNEPITRRMLDAINEAEFVFVDLTHPRPNVYYEAGYAQGSGKTPVYLARAGTNIPFDLKDYPVIFYPNLRELKASIRERLESIRSGRK
jgi:hypothetical protein